MSFMSKNNQVKVLSRLAWPTSPLASCINHKLLGDCFHAVGDAKAPSLYLRLSFRYTVLANVFKKQILRWREHVLKTVISSLSLLSMVIYCPVGKVFFSFLHLLNGKSPPPIQFQIVQTIISVQWFEVMLLLRAWSNITSEMQCEMKKSMGSPMPSSETQCEMKRGLGITHVLSSTMCFQGIRCGPAECPHINFDLFQFRMAHGFG